MSNIESKTILSVPTLDYEFTFASVLPESEHTESIYHDYYEFLLFISADNPFVLKDAEHPVKNNCMVLIPPLSTYRIVPTEGIKCEYYSCRFKKQFVFPYLTLPQSGENLLTMLTNYMENPITMNTVEVDRIRSFFLQLQQTVGSLAQSGLEDLQNIYVRTTLCKFLFDFYGIILKKQPQLSQSKKDLLVRQIMQYIDVNYREDISLHELERNFYLSRYYLCHLFKKISGITIFDYITQKKVTEAQKMLQSGNSDITKICYECGFNNIQHFYRSFKKVSGITPNQYRQSQNIVMTGT